jgi:hypothetical protein
MDKHALHLLDITRREKRKAGGEFAILSFSPVLPFSLLFPEENQILMLIIILN